MYSMDGACQAAEAPHPPAPSPTRGEGEPRPAIMPRATGSAAEDGRLWAIGATAVRMPLPRLAPDLLDNVQALL